MNVGVLVGTGGAVEVGGNAVAVDVGSGSRVFLGWVAVKVMKCGVMDATEVFVNTAARVGVTVDEGMRAVTACIVKAETVLRFETAKSTMFFGSISTLVGALGLSKANTEIIHSRAIPRVPDARTPRGPEYSLILPLVAS